MNIKQYSIGQTFGIPAYDKFVVEGYEPDPKKQGFIHIPKQEDHFKLRREFLRDIAAWWKASLDGRIDDGFLCYGPAGSGKTTSINYFASGLNIPVIEMTAHERMDVEDLLGGQTMIGGDLLPVDGPLTRAAKNGWWFLLNEGDAMDPSQQIALNEIVRGKPFTIPQTGETVVPHKNFRFLVTANTNFGGDETGSFHGTKQQNVAFGDRFFVTELNYPTEEEEVSVITKKHPEVVEPIARLMVKFANDIRKSYTGEVETGEPIELTMSTRTLLRWAYFTGFFAGGENPIDYALQKSYSLKLSPESRFKVHELLQRHTDDLASV